MNFMSFKEKANVPTKIFEQNGRALFMNLSNQIYLTKQIYQLHKQNHGRLGYLYFKEIVPIKMYKWISKLHIPQKSLSTDILYFLNKTFIKQSPGLYEYKTQDIINPVIDTNVYKSQMHLSNCDDNDNISTTVKMSNELLASDYGSIDVWKHQSVEVTNEMLRYGNKVPMWQKSMNTRHYDKANDGLASTVDRASINTVTLGYKGHYSDLVERKNQRYQKNNEPPAEMQQPIEHLYNF